MLALPAAIETLPMQHSIDLRRQQILLAIALFPSAAKTVCIVAAAVEAGTVAGGEGRGLIEKEQLGPAAAGHHVAAAAAEFQHTGEPGRRRPALLQQRPGCGIVDDAAVTDKQAALGGGD